MAHDELKTIAVVDDDDDVRTALTRLFSALGHRVVVFASAEEFEAESVVADCLIVDIRLPGLSGLELRDRLRRRAVMTPVILITGDHDRLDGDLANAADTLSVTKPFDSDELLAAIASVTESANSRLKNYAG